MSSIKFVNYITISSYDAIQHFCNCSFFPLFIQVFKEVTFRKKFKAEKSYNQKLAEIRTSKCYF